LSNALVDNGEDIKIPNGASGEVISAVVLNGREHTSLGKLGVHNLIESVTFKTTLKEINVSASKKVGKTKIDPSLSGGDISHLCGNPVEDCFIVPKSTLNEETFGETTEPIFVESGAS